MAIDKAVDSSVLNAGLTSIANAIRTKGGTTAQLAFPADFVQAINDIQTGGGTVIVTFHAPKNSTITYSSGSESGTVLMGSSTEATVQLTSGTYTLASVLPINGVDKTIFSKTVAIEDSTTIKMYPDGALYWYGMDIVEWNGTRTYTSVTTTNQYPYCNVSENSFLVTNNQQNTNPRTCGYRGTLNPISTTGYTSLKAIVDCSTAGSGTYTYNCMGQGSGTNIASGTTITRFNNPTTYSEISSNVAQASDYICLYSFFNYAAAHRTEVRVYAVWLE